MTTQEMLELVRTARAEWDALIAQIEPSRMIEPGVVGDWSVKDLIAHVTWSEREMVGVIRARALVGSDLWNLQLDQRNVVIVEESRAKSLQEVLEESRSVYRELIMQMETLRDEELNDAKYFKNMPADWIPWEMMHGNTWKHYPEHLADVEAWRTRERKAQVGSR